MTTTSAMRILLIMLCAATLGCIGLGCAGKRPPLTPDQLYAIRASDAEQMKADGQ